jgi:hypothetical protein
VQAQTIYPEGVTIHEPGTYDGYTLFVGGDGVVYLIDMDGSVVNTWVSPDTGDRLSAVEALPGGHILVYSSPQGMPITTALELDYDGNEVWRYEVPGTFPATFKFHHDSERLANGNTLLLCSQVITDPTISPSSQVDDGIIEVDWDGNLVWTWFMHEHFFELGWSAEGLNAVSEQAADWGHANSIDSIPENDHVLPALAEGNIIFSQRHTNTISIIDRTTGHIVYHLGPENHLTYGQHDPHMIPKGLVGAGNILVFNNGAGTGQPLKKTPAPGYSSVLEIDPATESVVWTYDAQASGLTRFSFWADIVSGAQRLPNGNTLICSGAKGRLFEINPDMDIIWEYMSPYKGSQGGAESLVVFRAYRMEYDWVPGPTQQYELPRWAKRRIP